MSDETLSREAVALIKLGEAVGQLGESEILLREARDQCHKLRRDRLAITRAYENVCRKLDEAIESLKFIAEEGGKTLESEYGDIHCNGIWCSDQAQHALYALEDIE